eukprot:TRINITY_DN31689_c0_g1_i1.p1 TRINITY_DN31689_c0_g1~~TRINITY_DN31689_c0_g1_i1.p1  ORF type:complete len:411 (-),score=75.55 TRINITY_DN31689_c0_g1_i1:359-1591(-)
MRLETFLGGAFSSTSEGRQTSSLKSPTNGLRTGASTKSAKLPAIDFPTPAGRKLSGLGEGLLSPSSPHGLTNGGNAETYKQVTGTDFEQTMKGLATKVGHWQPEGGRGGFTLVKRLQEAVRNHGRVDLMKAGDGSSVAVKVMPTKWVMTGPKEFRDNYPTASERPWYDFGFVATLNKRGSPFVCDLIGIFRDDQTTYVVWSFATEGDLFGWCDREPRPGKEREAMMKPVARQLFEAVRYIHTIGIAHRDLSLENVLLSTTSDGHYQVKLIDFGMGTLKRYCVRELRGKQSYQAPEMHTDEEYDAYLTDAFALGVILYAMAVQDYPWISTKRKGCQLFDYVNNFGLVKLLERRKLRKGKGERLIEVMSPQIVDLLVGILNFVVKDRSCLGEPCWSVQSRASVWSSQWLEER